MSRTNSLPSITSTPGPSSSANFFSSSTATNFPQVTTVFDEDGHPTIPKTSPPKKIFTINTPSSSTTCTALPLPAEVPASTSADSISRTSKTLVTISSTPSFPLTHGAFDETAQDKNDDSLSDHLHRHQHHQHHHHHHHHHHRYNQEDHHYHQGHGLKRQRSIKTAWYLPNWEASAADTLSPSKLGGTQKQRPVIRRTYSETSTSSVFKIAPASIATTPVSSLSIVASAAASTLQSEALKFDYSLLGDASSLLRFTNDNKFAQTTQDSKTVQVTCTDHSQVSVEDERREEGDNKNNLGAGCCCCCSLPCSCGQSKKPLQMLAEIEEELRRSSCGETEVPDANDHRDKMTNEGVDQNFLSNRSSSGDSCSSEDEQSLGIKRREDFRHESSKKSRASSVGPELEATSKAEENYKEKSPLHEIARIAMEIATTIVDGQESRPPASSKDVGDTNHSSSCSNSRPHDEAKADERIDLGFARCETADEEEDVMDEISLMHSRYEKIPMTDFSTEIRASVDVENFLSAETSLILDAPVTSLEAVVECLLRRTLHAHEMFTDAFRDAKKSFFIQDSVCQLSRTIQNRCRSNAGRYEYEQTWLCILGSLSTIQRRNVAIARLKNATNLGRTSQEVRFVILVVTPTKEKGTKNALELGRTFSTLFADAGLRAKLLAAESEFEFKLSLRQHVEQLSRVKKHGTEGNELVSTPDQPDHQTSHHHHPHQHQHHHHHRYHQHHHQNSQQHQKASHSSGERRNLVGIGLVKKRFGGSFKHPSQSQVLADQVRRIKSVRVRHKRDASTDRPLLQRSPQLVSKRFELNSHNIEQQQARQVAAKDLAKEWLPKDRDSSSEASNKSRFSKRLHHIQVQHHSQQQQQQQPQQHQQPQQIQSTRLSQHKKRVEKGISDSGNIEFIDDATSEERGASDGDDSCTDPSPGHQQRIPSFQLKQKQIKHEQVEDRNCTKLSFCQGMRKDIKARIPQYLSDFADGLSSRCALRKTATSSIFLYFACLLPSIAIGTANHDATEGYLDVKKTLYSQTIGGLTFALFGGQPMIVVMATVPLALYTKIVHEVSKDMNSEFETLFAWTSLWNAIFLLSYALFDVGRHMKLSTRSIEEVFAMFVAASMIVYAFKDVVHDFRTNYYSNTCLINAPKRHDVIIAQNQLPFISMETLSNNYLSTAQPLPPLDWSTSATPLPTDPMKGANESDSFNTSNAAYIQQPPNRKKRMLNVTDHHHHHHHRRRRRERNDISHDNSRTLSHVSIFLPYRGDSNRYNESIRTTNSLEVKTRADFNGYINDIFSTRRHQIQSLTINRSHVSHVMTPANHKLLVNQTPHQDHSLTFHWRHRRGLSKTASLTSETSNIIIITTTTTTNVINITNFKDQKHDPPSTTSPSLSPPSSPSTSSSSKRTTCTRESSLLCLLLTLATLWLSVFLYNFTKTPFLNASKRSLLADGSLPVSVILASFVGSYLFVDVKLEHVRSENRNPLITFSQKGANWSVILCGLPLGFLMSLLFFINQAVVEGVVNYKENRLKKSQAIHWDLFVISVINLILALMGLPLVQPSLPQTPLHIHALADHEDRVDQGKVNQKIISVRETRITVLATHLLIGATIGVFEVLRWIPRPVLDGLLLYLAVIIMLRKNQLFDRIMLLVTEQASYPPTHYIRTVPQRTIHTYTCVQLIQLLALCCVAFSGLAYVQLAFPLLLILLLPMRYKLFAYLFERKYLVSLDGS